jgi:hypothetical protein
MTAARSRLAAAAALVAAAVVLGAVLLSGDGGSAATVAWSGEKQIFQSGKPTDRILTGKIENTSLEDVTIDTEDIRILDAEGREVQSTARFLAAFAHGLYPWSLRGDNPRDLGSQERTRIGEMVKLRPGQVAPLTLSWRVAAGGEQPVQVDLGSTSLPLS